MPFSCAIAGTPHLHEEQYLGRRVASRPTDRRAGVVGPAAPMARRPGRLVTVGRFVTAVAVPATVAMPTLPAAGSFVTAPAISTVTAH